jgi:hypothetical protein
MALRIVLIPYPKQAFFKGSELCCLYQPEGEVVLASLLQFVAFGDLELLIVSPRKLGMTFQKVMRVGDVGHMKVKSSNGLLFNPINSSVATLHRSPCHGC